LYGRAILWGRRHARPPGAAPHEESNVAEVPKPPTLAAELYTALRLSPQRVRFMVVVTVLTCVVAVGVALLADPSQEATVDVDVAAFAVSGTVAFELQSLTDEFLNTLTSPSTIRITAEQLGIGERELEAGISSRREENATRVTVGYTDADVDRALEVATAASRNALRELAEQRVASASRDVDAAVARRDSATAALDAFEADQGQRGIPEEFARLTDLVDQLTRDLATGTATASIQAALDAAEARRAALEPAVRPAEALDAERAGAQDQLLEANTRLSQASSQLDAAGSDAVVQPGFSSEQSKLPGLLSALASGLVVGVLASYGISWLVQRRRTAAKPA
jgi:hypothetical protein